MAQRCPYKLHLGGPRHTLGEAGLGAICDSSPDNILWTKAVVSLSKKPSINSIKGFACISLLLVLLEGGF